MKSSIKNKRSVLTLQKLKDAFWTLYENKDIDKIRIVEITNLAGYNRSIFYEYFKNVYDVLNSIEQEIVQETVAIAKLIRLYITDKDVDYTNLDQIVSYYKKYERFLKVILLKEDNPRFKIRLKKSIYVAINKDIKNNMFLSNVEKDFFLEFYISGLINALIYWFKNTPTVKVEEFASIFKMLTSNSITSTLDKIIK